MDKKNLLIFISGGVALVLLFMLIVVAGSASKAQQQVQQLEQQKKALSGDLGHLQAAKQGLDQKIGELQGQLEQLNGEKAQLQEQFETATRERDEFRGSAQSLREDLDRARAELDEARRQAAQAKPQAQVEPVLDNAGLGDSAHNEYWARVLREKTELELKLDTLNGKFSEAKLNAERLEREKGEVSQELGSLERENQDLKREIDYNKKMIDSLTVDLAREKNNGFEIHSGIQGLKTENRLLTQRLKSVSERREAAEARLAELQARNKELETSLDKMQFFVKEKLQQMDSLQDEFTSIKSGQQEQRQAAPPSPRQEAISLPPIVIRSDGVQKPQETASRGETQARERNSVLAVNKDNNFVVINQGSVKGIRPGDVFKVFSPGEELAGEVEVIQVRENISAADIKREIQPIKVGFTVR